MNSTQNSGAKSSDALDGKSKPVASDQPEPTTARAALAVINLMDLPRFDQAKEPEYLQFGPTYLNYTDHGTLADANTFYAKMFESKGWKEVPPMLPPTDLYVDRLFERNGYYVRITLSPGIEKGELMVTLANLGNVDVRALPKLPDADWKNVPSTAVNQTYKTSSSVDDAADAIHKFLLESGWQPWTALQPSSIDLPGIRDLQYRKAACKLKVGVVGIPQDPADKTSIFYHSEPLIPFDIPMVDGSQTLKLDVVEHKAAFEMTDSRSELIALLQKHGQAFGWKLIDADKFEAKEIHRLRIDLETKGFLMASLSESGGKYSAWLERFDSPALTPSTNDGQNQDKSPPQ